MLRENYREICRAPGSRKRCGGGFARACAVEMRMDISQEQFYSRIDSKNAAKHLELVRAFPLKTHMEIAGGCVQVY